MLINGGRSRLTLRALPTNLLKLNPSLSLVTIQAGGTGAGNYEGISRRRQGLRVRNIPVPASICFLFEYSGDLIACEKSSVTSKMDGLSRRFSFVQFELLR
jgi:hypothetical protein